MPSLYFDPQSLPQETEALRQQVRAFLNEQLQEGAFTSQVDSWLAGASPGFSRKLGERGWIGMTWPKAYGGRARSSLERYVVTEELLAAGAPVAAHWVADRQMGPMILRYGSEEQKRYYLPPIAEGRSYWAIGMSEPDSGSDLASVQTAATTQRSGYRLNGRKIWSSGAHFCDYMMVFCRTSPLDTSNRHAGFSNFIVDLHSPGVSIRPIRLLTGEHHFNEVTFDNVFLSETCLLGHEGDGWAQVTAELAFERSGPERFLSTFPLLESFAAAIGKSEASEEEQIAIGQLIAQLWSLRRMSISVAGMLEAGQDPQIEAAVVKDVGTRFESNVTETLRSTWTTQKREDPAFTQVLYQMNQAILHAPGFTLRGGTNEILRGIVARGLGLR